MKPKLRFNDFSNEWEEVKLDDLYTFKNGINGDKTLYGKGIELISVSDILNNNYITHDVIKGKINIDDKILKENSVEYGDILFQRSSETFLEIGSSNVYLDDKVVTYGGFVIRGKKLKSNNNNPMFINFELKSPSTRKKIILGGAGSQHFNIGQEELKKVSIFLPNTNEQNKIADVINLLDKKIELQTKKIEDLKLFKKGLIHQMKKSSNDWSEYKIYEIFKITRGVVIPKIDLLENKTDKNIYPVYSSQTSNNGILGYDEKFDFDGKYLTWTTDGANAGKVFFRNGKFRCTNVCGVLYNDNNKYVNELTAELLNYATPKHVSYVGNPKLMNNAMGDIKVFLPDIDESDRISNILLTINNKLLLNTNRLNKLNELKKGLMQSMFV